MSGIIEILDKAEKLNPSLQLACDAVAQAATEKATVFVRISFSGETFRSHPFEETSMVARHNFRVPGNKTGFVELFLAHQAN
ncbi:MAG: hypothetical protein JNL03_16655, partial [Prolixibacteraceae bacterium]|nr:hypothetical protein [Prolixibacteraceae bacterium]